jgi:GT2 family glycosyltransferase
MKSLSIIIVTYNSELLIYDCLDSIFKFNDIGEELEIILVDNCSKNVKSTFESINQKYGGKVILVKSPINGGYGHGNNQGISISKSPIVAVMNPDVRLVSPIFQKAISRFKENLNMGLMGVNFVENSNNPLYFKPEYNSLFKLVFGKFLLKFNFYKIKEVFFSGSFMLFNKKHFEEIGLYDENIFMYHEEADVSNRMLAIGKDTILESEISVLHLVHGREFNPLMVKIGSDSRAYYFKKYKGDLIRYYRNLILIYNAKYFIALLLNNKTKKNEFNTWIKICSNGGKL